MSLPDYFMADLPAEAELTSTMIGQACETLRRNREHYLAGRSVLFRKVRHGTPRKVVSS